MNTNFPTPPRAHGAPAAAQSGQEGAAASATPTAATPAGVVAPASSHVSSQLLEMSNLLIESEGNSSSGADDAEAKTEPVSNSNSSPWLPPPGTPLSADYLGMMCAFYNNKSAENQLGPLQQQLKMKSNQQLEELDRSNEIIKKNIDAAKKARAAKKSQSILGWIRQSVSFVAAVAVVASLCLASGPASPLVMTVAVGCLLNSTMSLAAYSCEAADVPPLPGSVSAALQLGLTSVLQAAMKDDKLAAGLGMMITGVAATLLSGGSALLVDPGFAGQAVGGAVMVGGTGEDKTAMVAACVTLAATLVTAVLVYKSTPASNPAELEGQVNKCLKGVEIFSGMTQAGTGVYHGYLTLEITDLQATQMRFQADNLKISALISKLQGEWENSKDEVNRVIDALSSNYQVIAGILSGEYEQKSGMQAKLNGRAAV